MSWLGNRSRVRMYCARSRCPPRHGRRSGCAPPRGTSGFPTSCSSTPSASVGEDRASLQASSVCGSTRRLRDDIPAAARRPSSLPPPAESRRSSPVASSISKPRRAPPSVRMRTISSRTRSAETCPDQRRIPDRRERLRLRSRNPAAPRNARPAAAADGPRGKRAPGRRSRGSASQLQVRPAPDVIEHFPGVRIQQQRVDREIPRSTSCRGSVSKWTPSGRLPSSYCVVAAEGGDLHLCLIARGPAPRRSARPPAGVREQDAADRRDGAGRDVVILGLRPSSRSRTQPPTR